MDVFLLHIPDLSKRHTLVKAESLKEVISNTSYSFGIAMYFCPAISVGMMLSRRGSTELAVTSRY
jgi:hypothetical protein